MGGETGPSGPTTGLDLDPDPLPLTQPVEGRIFANHCLKHASHVPLTVILPIWRRCLSDLFVIGITRPTTERINAQLILGHSYNGSLR